ncbi:MAG: hypothetical protein ACLU2Y_04345 [Blautia massiliensis (ex Durand et al. 2017)]|uniref:hypothetical protein n=1 Tax=Blautia massiliensis (ex Durand et al. 2017) TaxID=1737424 RepID=UPI00399CD56B
MCSVLFMRRQRRFTGNKESSQEETDAQTGILDYVMKNMKKASQTKVDKTGLHEIASYGFQYGRQGRYLYG